MKADVIKKFIVLEGLDGAGTSTQLRLLSEKLQEGGSDFYTSAEPTSGPVGNLLRAVLRGTEAVHPSALALLFAADRAAHVFGPGGITEHAARGQLCICDRYLWSSLAYQGVQCGLPWLQQINSRFPWPQLLFLIDTPPEICQERLNQRSQRELFDDLGLQRQVYENYHRVLKASKRAGLNLEILDGRKPAHEIFAVIWERSAPIMGI